MKRKIMVIEETEFQPKKIIVMVHSTAVIYNLL